MRRVTHERADNVPSVQGERSMRSGQAFRARDSQVSIVTSFQLGVSVLSSDRHTPSSSRAHARLVDPLLCYPSEGLQLWVDQNNNGEMPPARRDRNLKTDRC